MKPAAAIALVAIAPAVALAQTAPPPPAYGYPYSPSAPPAAIEDELDPPHRAPRNALWVGARVGYAAPLGDAYVDKATLAAVSERDLVGPGPGLEADVGARFGRGFLPFFFAANTFAAKGAGAGVTSSSSNLLGFGLRYAFAPDAYGFVAEIAFGYRLTHAKLASGSELSAGAPGELRLGIGGDLRVADRFSLSPIVTLAIGSYSDVTVTAPGDFARNVVGTPASHGYVGLALGGHFDIFGKP